MYIILHFDYLKDVLGNVADIKTWNIVARATERSDAEFLLQQRIQYIDSQALKLSFLQESGEIVDL